MRKLFEFEHTMPLQDCKTGGTFETVPNELNQFWSQFSIKLAQTTVKAIEQLISGAAIRVSNRSANKT